MENQFLWRTMAAIQRCSEMTPNGYTHHRRPLADSCTRSTTVEAGHSHRKSHNEEKISPKYQHDHNLCHGFPDASAPIILCVNCGRGFKSQIGLFSHQRGKHVMDETLHCCHHRTRWTAKKKKKKNQIATNQGCHSWKLSKFPDFSLTQSFIFPDHAG